LSKTPAFILIKSRVNGGRWQVWTGETGMNGLYLDHPMAASPASEWWNNTSPSSSVITLGSDNQVNLSGDDFIAYCFHSVEGYSKVGSYTGNGSTDGTFVHCGFRPAYVMVKRTDAADHWALFDSSRNTYNEVDSMLGANYSNVEYSGSPYATDFLSNGFKLRNTADQHNANGGTYIFYAVAETDFKYSNGR